MNRIAIGMALVWGALSLAGGSALAGGVAESRDRPIGADVGRIGEAFAWSQMLPDGGLLVRALVGGESPCPAARFSGGSVDLRERPPATRDQFAVRLCEAGLSADQAARLGGVSLHDGRTLPLAPRKQVLDSIIVIGDTGCRQTYYAHQGCNDAQDWPFAQVARLAARQQPDLVLHVGDYHYREKPCPDANAACAGSPWGDNWPVWRADFFAPARPLLAAAPWVAVRGNHENCERAGQGWLHFLALRSAASPPQTCRAVTDPVRLDFGNLALTVLDSASVTEPIYSPADVSAFAASCGAIGALRRELAAASGRLHLLAVHHPGWVFDGRTQTIGYRDARNSLSGGIVDPAAVHSRDRCAKWARDGAGGVAPIPPANNEPLQMMPLTTIRDTLSAIPDAGAVATILSGHVHNFQSIRLPGGTQMPVHQLIVGNSGTRRSGVAVPISASPAADGKPRVPAGACRKRTAGQPDRCDRADFDWRGRAQAVAHAFGYLHLQRVGDAGWRGIVRDDEDRPVAVCVFPTGSNRAAATAVIVAVLKDEVGRILPTLDGRGCAVLALKMPQ